MDKVLKKGDTICCHDLADMREVSKALRNEGYLVSMNIGYVVRIEAVPIEEEADGH